MPVRVRVVLEPDQPMQAVPVDDLPVPCVPRPLLQIIDDVAALGQTQEQVRRVEGSAVPSRANIMPWH